MILFLSRTIAGTYHQWRRNGWTFLQWAIDLKVQVEECPRDAQLVFFPKSGSTMFDNFLIETLHRSQFADKEMDVLDADTEKDVWRKTNGGICYVATSAPPFRIPAHIKTYFIRVVAEGQPEIMVNDLDMWMGKYPSAIMLRTGPSAEIKWEEKFPPGSFVPTIVMFLFIYYALRSCFQELFIPALFLLETTLEKCYHQRHKHMDEVVFTLCTLYVMLFVPHPHSTSMILLKCIHYFIYDLFL